jgi:putative transposase
MKKRFTEAQIVGFLREADAGVAIKDLCRKHGFSEGSYYVWRSKFGGMSVSDAKRLKELETENTRLKKLLAESHLEIEVTREVLRKKSGDRTGSTRGGADDGDAGAQRASGPDRGPHERVGLAVRAAPGPGCRFTRSHPRPGASAPSVWVGQPKRHCSQQRNRVSPHIRHVGCGHAHSAGALSDPDS